MKCAFYSVVSSLTGLIAKLPLQVQYAFASLLYLFTYYIIGYRKKVVQQNLERSFPEKNAKEIKRIKKAFYKHFTDMIIEVNAVQGFDEKKMLEHVKFRNPEVLEKLYEAGKSVILVLGHYGNWENVIAIPLISKYKVLAVYQPLSNWHMDQYIYMLRSKFGAEPIPMKHIYRELNKRQQEGERNLSIFVADQSPTRGQIKKWVTFLNQPTGVFQGAEKIAKKLNQAVVFYKVYKVKRGMYEIEFVPLINDPAEMDDQEITMTHLQELEKMIQEHPEYWLWTHRRWKHQPVEKTDA